MKGEITGKKSDYYEDSIKFERTYINKYWWCKNYRNKYNNNHVVCLDNGKCYKHTDAYNPYDEPFRHLIYETCFFESVTIAFIVYIFIEFLFNLIFF